ncbi:hypothetical protein KIS4809_3356 [Bacillus sp. ZZV12-4809]|nr:hypothetical protein KIS4809_3356 [Bacillus sp. ZZV12-4809]
MAYKSFRCFLMFIKLSMIIGLPNVLSKEYLLESFYIHCRR